MDAGPQWPPGTGSAFLIAAVSVAIVVVRIVGVLLIVALMVQMSIIVVVWIVRVLRIVVRLIIARVWPAEIDAEARVGGGRGDG
jgi:hypothetical protein